MNPDLKEMLTDNRKLLITVVPKGKGSEVITVSKDCGCEGGTIIPGKGTSRDSASSFWGFTFDPEKDVVFTMTENDKARHLMDVISDKMKLDEPQNGITFILNVRAIAGVAHLMNP